MIHRGIDILKEEGKLVKDDLIIIAGGAEIIPEIDSDINKIIGGIVKI